MIKKIFVILSLSTFIINLSFASDLLADLTNGKLTENSPGVKVLSLDEKKSVKGGYFDSVYSCNNNTCLGYAIQSTITGSHVNDWRAVTLESVEPSNSNWTVGFASQKNIGVSSLGNTFVYFTYGAFLIDTVSGQSFKQSSLVLNNNGIVRELSYRYKDIFDRNLGGLQSRAINRITK